MGREKSDQEMMDRKKKVAVKKSDKKMSKKKMSGRKKSAKMQVLPMKKVIVIRGPIEIGAELVLCKRTGEILALSNGSRE